MLSSRSLTVAVLGCAVLVAGCDRQSAGTAQPAEAQSAAAAEGAVPEGTVDRTHRGSAIPSITVKDGAGKELALGSLKGQPVLINLWATWCAPCVAELPALNRLAETRGKALRIVTVSQDMAKLENVNPFLKPKAPLLEPWLDPEGELGTFYDVNVLPTSIYYDAQGREVWRYVGPLEWDKPAAASLLAEKV